MSANEDLDSSFLSSKSLPVNYNKSMTGLSLRYLHKQMDKNKKKKLAKEKADLNMTY